MQIKIMPEPMLPFVRNLTELDFGFPFRIANAPKWSKRFVRVNVGQLPLPRGGFYVMELDTGILRHWATNVKIIMTGGEYVET